MFCIRIKLLKRKTWLHCSRNWFKILVCVDSPKTGGNCFFKFKCITTMLALLWNVIKLQVSGIRYTVLCYCLLISHRDPLGNVSKASSVWFRHSICCETCLCACSFGLAKSAGLFRKAFFWFLIFVYGLKMFQCLSEKEAQTRKPWILGMFTWMEFLNGGFGVGAGALHFAKPLILLIF